MKVSRVPGKIRYDPKRSDLTVEQIGERISRLMQIKRIKQNGGKRMAAPEIAFVDIETTGLNKQENIILEVGIVLTDRELNVLDQWDSVVADENVAQHVEWLEKLALDEPNHRGQEPWSGARFVYEMHTKNGLLAEISSTMATGGPKTLASVSHEAADWLRSHNIGRNLNPLPMTGSSVHFDRGFIEWQMPILNEQFHYRNTDVSTLKNLVDLYRNDLVQARQTEAKPVGSHRAVYDCMDTISELRFYLENLFRKDI